MESESIQIDEFPQIVLERVFYYLNYDEVAKCREVCKRFNGVGMSLLNKGFQRLEHHHSMMYKLYKSYLPKRESERFCHPLQRYVEILSSIDTRISLMRMTFNRFIEANLCCFIPGKVIDEIFRILRIVKSLGVLPNHQNHRILQEMRDITSMAMEHFEEKIAPSLKRHLYITNAKKPYFCQRTTSSYSILINEVAVLEEHRNLNLQLQKLNILNKRMEIKYNSVLSRQKQFTRTINVLNHRYSQQKQEIKSLRNLLKTQSLKIEILSSQVQNSSNQTNSPTSTKRRNSLNKNNTLRRSKRLKSEDTNFN